MKPLKTILLVEDDEDDRQIFRDAFFDVCHGCELTTACTGVEALAVLATMSHVPDALVTDFNLPMLNGLELIEAIRLNPRYNCMTIIVMSTSYTAGQVCLNHGASYCYLKPSSLDVYTAIVEEIIAKI